MTREEIKLLLEEERKIILYAKEICESELRNKLKIDDKHESIIPNTQMRMLGLVKRVFEDELEFLESRPVDYFEIYLEDEN
jgi:hypothetical protein